MRRFLWIIIALFVFPWFAGEAASPAIATADNTSPWRRTSQGWQRMDSLLPPLQYHRPALHPAVVGSLEALLTMTAMLALSGDGPTARAKRLKA